VSQGDCIHWWRIPPGGSRIVTGTCLKCGATREFMNDTDDLYEMAEEQKKRISAAAKRRWAERRQEARPR
jgi:hypothetical protein